MTRPIPDKAEVKLDLPDKSYIGTFGRSAQFDARLDQTGVLLTLHRTGDVRKAARMHFHYGLFADILRNLASTVSAMPPHDAAHRDTLQTAAETLYRALEAKSRCSRSELAESESKEKNDASAMTPEDEVLLLHVME